MSLTRGTQPASYCAGCYRGCGNTCLIIVVQSLSHVCLWPLLVTVSWSLLKLLCIESVMLFNHVILCHPLLLLPSMSPSIRVFSNELAPHTKWPKYCHFRYHISPSNEYSGLISFRIDWLDLHADSLRISKRFSRVFSNTTIGKHQFFSTQPSLWSSSHIYTWLLEKPWFWLQRPLST